MIFEDYIKTDEGFDLTITLMTNKFLTTGPIELTPRWRNAGKQLLVHPMLGHPLEGELVGLRVENLKKTKSRYLPSQEFIFSYKDLDKPSD